MATQDSRKGALAEVWVGVQHHTPNHPPNPPTVQRVFGNEKAARKWADEFNLRPNKMYGEYRSVTRWEVEDDA